MEQGRIEKARMAVRWLSTGENLSFLRGNTPPVPCPSSVSPALFVGAEGVRDPEMLRRTRPELF
jgi:hypothetical protein